MTDEATIQEIVEQIRKRADAPPETRISFMDYDRDILLQAYDKLKEDFEDETTDKEYFQQQWYEGKTRIAELEAQLQAKESEECTVCEGNGGSYGTSVGACEACGRIA